VEKIIFIRLVLERIFPVGWVEQKVKGGKKKKKKYWSREVPDHK